VPAQPESDEGPEEAPDAARRIEHGDARSRPAREDLLAEEREQHEDASQRQSEAGVGDDERADPAMAHHVARTLAQLGETQQVDETGRFGLARLPLGGEGLARLVASRDAGGEAAQK